MYSEIMQFSVKEGSNNTERSESAEVSVGARKKIRAFPGNDFSWTEMGKGEGRWVATIYNCMLKIPKFVYLDKKGKKQKNKNEKQLLSFLTRTKVASSSKMMEKFEKSYRSY